jgi:hypothetical protein
MDKESQLKNVSSFIVVMLLNIRHIPTSFMTELYLSAS